MKINPRIILLGVAVLLAGFMFLNQSFAQSITGINSAHDINTKILCKVFGWMFSFFLVASSIAGLIAAYFYLTSQGDAKKIETATKMLAYTAVAIVVALAAKGLPGLIASLFGISSGQIDSC